MTLISVSTCRREPATMEPPELQAASRLTLDWNTLILDLERHTPGYRPPMSARMFAYVGMAAYEASLPALPDHLSLAAHLPGYVQPDMRMENGGFHLPASLNAAYARTLRYFFQTAPKHLLEAIDRLEADKSRLYAGKVDPQVLNRSAAFGCSAADAVWKWSTTDTVGHDGFLYNYDRNYVPPAGPGLWKPSGPHPMPPLAPHWGDVRPFVVSPQTAPVRPPLPFDESPGSAFYTEAMEVFTVSQPLSKDNLWIADFWSDDFSGLTVTPAGRWISIVNQVIAKARPSFSQALEIYLKAGLALADSGINCWNGKYKYNLERPEEFIRRVIRPDWKPLHDSPNFPAYPSGHSIFGAAVAEVLAAEFGDTFTLTDRTHEDRREFYGAPRTFHSFSEMARENALSRVAIGVHYRMDCEEGLRLGKIIGQKVAALPVRRPEAKR